MTEKIRANHLKTSSPPFVSGSFLRNSKAQQGYNEGTTGLQWGYSESTGGVVRVQHGYSGGWMDELGFYVPSTVFQSFRDDGRVNMKGSVQ